MKTEVKLRIADTVIAFKSRFAHEDFNKLQEEEQFSERFKNFLYTGDSPAHIQIKVNVVKKLPPPKDNAKMLFLTRHFQDRSENWRILKDKDTYIYRIPLKSKQQIMFVNSGFNAVDAYVMPKKKKYIWKVTDFIYDFLQVLLIDYFSRRNKGIFVHAVGIKDTDNKGLLFPGKSGAGKTTTAKIWHRQTKAMILNDDRIIIRKKKGGFFMYGTPWHGTFSDYLSSHMEPACLDRAFFIYHNSRNISRRVSCAEAFKLLYPTLLAPFWNRKQLENVADFCQDLVKMVNCFRLGFVKNKNIINYIRKI
jgi:hypothetical protein